MFAARQIKFACNLNWQQLTGSKAYFKICTSANLNLSWLNQFSLFRKKYVLANACANFHTTSVQQKKKPMVKKPIKFKKKSNAPPAELYKNISVENLADQLNIPLDNLYELMLYVEGAEEYDAAHKKIKSLSVIQKVAKLCKRKYIMVSNAPPPPPKVSQDIIRQPPPNEEDLVPRPPVVTIMGHVDHGKTTLLDYLRKSSIVQSEFGGITQHIGAFEVALPSGEKATFLDTPGHAAFSAMRARGANVTDIIVLVVAAEDGVMPQTQEVIELATKSDIPLVVAINKIDAPNADVPRCREMLLHAGVQLESQGGETQAVEISALKGINISNLIEAIVVQAELSNLKGDPKGLVEGHIIESKTDPLKGKIATCLVQRGTLQKGDVLVCGTSFCKVRSMVGEGGVLLKEAKPSTPVQILGWKNLPKAGDEFLETESEQRAKSIIEWRRKTIEDEKLQDMAIEIEKQREADFKEYREQRQVRLNAGLHRNKHGIQRTIDVDHRPRISILLQGDVDGSVEAIMDILDTYDSEQIELDVVGYGVGEPSPIQLGFLQGCDGLLYTFNLKLSPQILKIAKVNNIPVREHNVIYELVDQLKSDISSKIPVKMVEHIEGEGMVLQEFIVTIEKKKVPIAGCFVESGSFKKDYRYKVYRGDEVIYDGGLKAMKHHKNDVQSIKKETECGLQFEDKSIRFEKDDKIICYKIVPTEQKTDWEPFGFD